MCNPFASNEKGGEELGKIKYWFCVRLESVKITTTKYLQDYHGSVKTKDPGKGTTWSRE